MPIEVVAGFAIAAAILQLLPGKGKRRLLSYAGSGAPLRIAAAALAVCLSATLVMTLLLFVLGSVMALSGIAAAVLGGFGLSVLLVGGMIAWRLRGLTGPIADNDNLPATKPLQTFAKVGLENLRDRWQALLFAALASQFVVPGNEFFQQTLVLACTFFAVSGASVLFYVFAPHWLLRRLRRLETRKIKGRARGCLRVGSGSVTVGYRRLAA